MSKNAKSDGDICDEIKLTALAFSKVHDVEFTAVPVFETLRELASVTVNVLLKYPPAL